MKRVLIIGFIVFSTLVTPEKSHAFFGDFLDIAGKFIKFTFNDVIGVTGDKGIGKFITDYLPHNIIGYGREGERDVGIAQAINWSGRAIADGFRWSMKNIESGANSFINSIKGIGKRESQSTSPEGGAFCTPTAYLACP